MHKDSTYTLRLDSKMKAALKVAARRDRRTVASLIEKLIADHLTKEGFTLPDGGRTREVVGVKCDLHGTRVVGTQSLAPPRT